MLPDDLLRQGEHVMTVCNACRYCEGFCPVFPAMESRLVFAKADLTYLANLCHNCGECLYSCQYAPPHEFGINVPRTLAEIRLASYEEYCWPKWLGASFRRHGLQTSLALAAGLSALMFAAALALGAEPLWVRIPSGDFYRVMPHATMVGLFGAVSALIAIALVTGFVRFWRDVGEQPPGLSQSFALIRALGDALRLKHLHGDGVDCTSGEETRSPWRRRFHHFTAFGFLLCFASTTVAGLYHVALGWRAPYAYTSLPVLLGIAGGVGLLIGPVGLYAEKRKRDGALADPAQRGLDDSFIVLLVLTSLTGLLLLVFREQAAMSALLIVHLGSVLTLFLTLPYGKFVHGIYRTAALIVYELESSRARHETEVSGRKVTKPKYDDVRGSPQVDPVTMLGSD